MSDIGLDAGADSGQDASGLSASNVGATTNFSVNATGVVRGGVWTIQNGGGHNAITNDYNRQLDFMVTGTTCVFLNYYATNANMNVTVRNAAGTVEVATFTPAVTTNAWQTNLTLFSGLSDTPHWVTLHFPAQWLVDSDNTFGVTGAAPTLTYPSGFGPTTVLTTVGVSSHLLLTNLTATTLGGLSLYYATYTDSEVWFYATGDQVWVRTYGNSAKLRLVNVDTGSAYVATEGNGPEWMRLATGQGTSRHLYRLSASINTQTGQTFNLEAIMTDAATPNSGLDLTVTIPPRPILTVYGDSITAGVIGTSSQSWLSYGRLLAESKNYGLYNLGIGGASVNAAYGGPTNSGEVVARCNIVIASNPTYCLVLYGTNDVNGAVTIPNFQASFQSMCDQLATGLPSTKFIVMSCLPTNYGNRLQSTANPYNTAISTVTASKGANWTYVNTVAWGMAGGTYEAGGALGTFNTTNFSDGLHPNSVGYTFMTTRLAPYVTAFAASSIRRGFGIRHGFRSLS